MRCFRGLLSANKFRRLRHLRGPVRAATISLGVLFAFVVGRSSNRPGIQSVGMNGTSANITWSGPFKIKDHELFCADRAAYVPNEVTVADSVARFGSEIMKKSNEIAYQVRVIEDFTVSRSLGVVISQCSVSVHWIAHLPCNQHIDVFVYLKCHEALLFERHSTRCIKYIDLTNAESMGPEGTLRYHISVNYDALSDYTYVCKDREQAGARLDNIATGPLKRLSLGLLAIGHDGGFVHTAQDPVFAQPMFIHDIFTLLSGQLSRKSSFHRCGNKTGFLDCKRHWWYRFMDPRTSDDYFSALLTQRTGVRHVKRDRHNYSFFQAIRIDQTGARGRIALDTRGFPAQPSSDKEKLKVERFCHAFELLTCASCNNAWIPARTQFIVSRRRIRSIPKEFFTADENKKVFSEYNWGFLFNCFVSYESHKESEYPYLRCADKV